jgi:hypothetical protein
VAKVRVLQVDKNRENLAELEAGVIAGRTVGDWQMPQDSMPGDLVIWYAAGRYEYIARGRVDTKPEPVKEGPGPYRGRVNRMERIEPGVARKKVMGDCGFDGGKQSYQTLDGREAADFLESLGLSHLVPDLRQAPECPTCHCEMPLTGICDDCG